MFQITNLNKEFISKKGITSIALSNVSLKLPSKGLVFILGKSGSGKSTLLNLLGGLDYCDNGEIIINNTSLRNLNANDIDCYRNGNIGFIFQDFNLIEDMNVFENVALPLQLQGKKVNPNLINQLLKDVEMSGFGYRKINELSGGQKQRVAIIRAIVKNPQIILADEPTGNLDSETGTKIFNILQTLSKEKLVCIVSHDHENAYNYSDRVIEFKDGKIISDLTREPLKKETPKIKLERGQVLTEELLSQIQQQGQASHQLKKQFTSTDPTKIKNEGQPLLKIPSILPSKIAFKIGSSFLKNKKISTAFVSLASNGLSFAFYGAIIALITKFSFYNQTKAQVPPEALEQIIKKFNIDKFIISFIVICLFIKFLFWITTGGFVKKSIQFKHKDIGILRALGARGKDVFKIFFSEGLMIAILATIWSIILFIIKWVIWKTLKPIMYSVCNFIIYVNNQNNQMYSWELKNQWLFSLYFVFLIEFILCLLLIFLTSYYAIKKLSRKKPIDVILKK
ncbi:ATP-binding cassette domain-containing protein ['Fragaria x ananassa' phyllody phytoplasma]|uniref:ATP-binding cassette domain-containing protein n=1 Tax='Fragaria x ananassa' phyllody phytoplasma TaxID=2358428 RepID=A0ABS5K3E2_9MOLU|nr:ATP-binding cassette domain-containing protein ['Fragaria x ananassa' phyllody phytoplasma]MBS2126431.1 ATP-binding cassette domain-containing protein ['Fragaria x ananassa' phyllody phytoplasma]